LRWASKSNEIVSGVVSVTGANCTSEITALPHAGDQGSTSQVKHFVVHYAVLIPTVEALAQLQPAWTLAPVLFYRFSLACVG
jgi:hypothetical protein